MSNAKQHFQNHYIVNNWIWSMFYVLDTILAPVYLTILSSKADQVSVNKCFLYWHISQGQSHLWEWVWTISTPLDTVAVGYPILSTNIIDAIVYDKGHFFCFTEVTIGYSYQCCIVVEQSTITDRLLFTK